MKTVSVNVMDLCAPCANRCRYCLLSYNGCVSGVAPERAMDYARRFAAWLRENRPEVSFLFGWGYSMEHPKLFDMIRCARELDCITGQFLQFDGMDFRTGPELETFLRDLKNAGIRVIDLTFYGSEEYHDRFAARKGDYRLMMDTLRAANRVGMDVSVSIPLTRENLGQLEELFFDLSRYETVRVACFIPHAEGRGASLDPVRLTVDDWESLPRGSSKMLNRLRFRTEGDWVTEEGLPVEQERALTFTLTEESLTFFESLGFAGAMEYLEGLDDDYHRAVPDFTELCRRYGDPAGRELYSLRDLHQHYQRRYIAEHGLKLYDIHDERQSFVRRF